LLRIDNLKVDPLPPLTFSVGNGECLAIEGPSGSGKTRLLRAIADLDEAPGQVFLDGAERREMRAPDWRKRVRYASAEPAWWTDTAREVFPATRSDAANRLSRLLNEMALKPELVDRPLIELSTGERQRLALARALIDDPAVLLLDEPTTGLDAQSSALVEELIRYQLLAGKSVILASHDQAQIGRLSHARLQLARPLPLRKERRL
jgi:putative ABC transport system ATP-binding protein